MNLFNVDRDIRPHGLLGLGHVFSCVWHSNNYATAVLGLLFKNPSKIFQTFTTFEREMWRTTSSQNHLSPLNHNFPMVFQWFSYGLPATSPLLLPICQISPGTRWAQHMLLQQSRRLLRRGQTSLDIPRGFIPFETWIVTTIWLFKIAMENPTINGGFNGKIIYKWAILYDYAK